MYILFCAHAPDGFDPWVLQSNPFHALVVALKHYLTHETVQFKHFPPLLTATHHPPAWCLPSSLTRNRSKPPTFADRKQETTPLEEAHKDLSSTVTRHARTHIHRHILDKAAMTSYSRSATSKALGQPQNRKWST